MLPLGYPGPLARKVAGNYIQSWQYARYSFAFYFQTTRYMMTDLLMHVSGVRISNILPLYISPYLTVSNVESFIDWVV